jgi:hypothetical protein
LLDSHIYLFSTFKLLWFLRSEWQIRSNNS